MEKTRIVVAFGPKHPEGRAVILTKSRAKAVAAYEKAVRDPENTFVGYAHLHRWEKRGKPAIVRARQKRAAALRPALRASAPASSPELDETKGETLKPDPKTAKPASRAEEAPKPRRGRPPGSGKKGAKAPTDDAPPAEPSGATGGGSEPSEDFSPVEPGK